MNEIVFCTYGHTPATEFAVKNLKEYGYAFCNNSCDSCCTYLLLPVPSFLPDGTVRGGGLLPHFNDNVTVIGGNIDLPYPTIDLLKDPHYLAENAMITAHCAVKIAASQLPCILTDNHILIIGSGRIGKCLSQLLRQIGCSVTVAARKVTDRAILSSLGYNAIDTINIDPDRYNIIFNTAPELLIPDCRSNAMIIDLASTPGITGKGVITARGLPAKEAPQSSGRLIASTIHRILQDKEV